MNEQLQKYARDTLKTGILQCTESQQLLFKRMYSHKDLNMALDKVIDNMPEEKLDWAMRQVEKTLEEKTSAIKKE